jgi:error-prone DNA polymerase
VRHRSRVTRRDLLLQVAGLDRHARAVDRASRGRGLAGRKAWSTATPAQTRAADAAARNSTDPTTREAAPELERHPLADQGVWAKAAAQSKATRPPRPVTSVQLALDLGDEPGEGPGELTSGLPEMTDEERMKAELEILGLDVSRHVVDTYAGFFEALGVTRSKDLRARRSKAELLVAGVKVATQTPPIRSGRRVIFLTLDDATGPVDATFFEDAQGPYAATVFHSWLLVVRGELRRTGRRGVSVRATGCWALPDLFAIWQAAPTSAEGIRAVREVMAVVPEGFASVGEEAVTGAAESRSTRPVMTAPGDPTAKGAAGGMGRRRVLVHSSGFKVSPYADVRPAGESAKDLSEPARKLWHRSQGSAG